jgi:hypothetical protein
MVIVIQYILELNQYMRKTKHYMSLEMNQFNVSQPPFPSRMPEFCLHVHVHDLFRSLEV